MKRLLSLLCVLCLCTAVLRAQDDGDEYEGTESTPFSYFMNQHGDQYLRIALGASFPCGGFEGSLFDDSSKLKIGGLGSLGYHYFLTSLIAVGADATFGFHVTIGSHVLNYIPIVGTFTFQPTFSRFEFPITVGIGFAWQMYNNYTYWPGLVIKPEAGVHFRINPSWSLGLECTYMFMPEFDYDDSSKNVYGQFIVASVVARYYF
ncbi:MAG: hypothetical protein J1D88_02560 [Treponema sp.]|nr:hypothetical protein [Treponema sp.]